MSISYFEDKVALSFAKMINSNIELDANIGYCAKFKDRHLTSAFQPILSYSEEGCKIYGYEALLRSVNEQDKFSPYHFIMNMDDEERRIIDGVARATHIRNFRLMNKASKSLKLFLNSDPVIYLNTALQNSALSLMLSRARNNGLDPENIIFELMETKAGNSEVLESCTGQLRAFGVLVAIDDYGVDCSGLERVQQINPDLIKFDRSWLTKGRASKEQREEFYRHVKNFRDKNIKILIEGVEFEEDLMMVEHIKPDFVQGYWYGRPMKINHLLVNELPLDLEHVASYRKQS